MGDGEGEWMNVNRDLYLGVRLIQRADSEGVKVKYIVSRFRVL